jgi:hypothetical protein
MATAAVLQTSSAPTHTPQTVQSTTTVNLNGPHDVHTVLHYHKPNEDGSPPHPTYVDRPETYDRPFEIHPVTVHDVRGHEKDYTLDGNGFQFHRHSANEKDFLDDEKIKSGYYAETEQLLKDV